MTRTQQQLSAVVRPAAVPTANAILALTTYGTIHRNLMLAGLGDGDARCLFWGHGFTVKQDSETAIRIVAAVMADISNYMTFEDAVAYVHKFPGYGPLAIGVGVARFMAARRLNLPSVALALPL